MPRGCRLNPDTESSDVTMVFGGLWKECDQSGSSIRLIGGICARLVYLQLVFRPHSHVSRQKKNTQKTGFSHGRGSNHGSQSWKGIPVAGMLSMHGTDLLISKVSHHLQVKHFRKDD